VAGPVRALDAQGLVLDAQALIAFLEHEPGTLTLVSLLTRATDGTVELSTTTVNAGEVLLTTERRRGAQAAFDTLDLLQALPIDIVPVDLELASRAAWFKLRGGLSYADCYAAALAHRDGVPVLTADREFERVADTIDIAWLAD
jgi:predicted nucleic acid-binding protein